jgi:hypothetical protein
MFVPQNTQKLVDSFYASGLPYRFLSVSSSFLSLGWIPSSESGGESHSLSLSQLTLGLFRRHLQQELLLPYRLL